MDSFCVYHINAPGQEPNAEQIPVGTEYPTMEQLAETVYLIVDHFKLADVTCIGVGLGANVLARFAVN